MRVTKVSSGWVRVDPVIDMKMRALCVKPYYGHRDGCPNFNNLNRLDCPPRAPKINEFFNLSEPVFAIYNVFNFKVHCNRMRDAHPEWSIRAVECCLYWQQSARKQHKAVISRFEVDHPRMVINRTPEAMGVNVTETMANVGIYLEWPPINYTYQIALAGTGLLGSGKVLTFEDLIGS